MNAGGNLVNTVTADSDETLPTTDTNTIPITQSPAMTVDKTSTTTSVTTVGQTVTYSFLVTNTGNIPLSGITVTDPKVPSINCNGQTTLAVGASMTCTGTHTVTQAEMTAGGNLVNTVTADSDQTLPTTDTNTIPITQSPAMTVDKTSTTSSVTLVGQVVTYSFLVTNTGNVPLSGITLTDPKVASINCNGQTTLAVGQSMTCSGSHTVTQAEMTAGGNLVNTVTAVSDQTLPTTDTNTIPITQSPAMTVDKTSTTTSVTTAGQTVTYSFLVKNTGNIPLSGITLTDPKVASINCNGQTTLAVGQSMTCSGTHTVTQAEIDAGGNLVNTVTTDSDQTGPTTDTNTIPITSTRNLTIAKAANKTSVAGGDEITYTLTYGNTGNATATGTTITEPLPGGTSFVSCTGGTSCGLSDGTVTFTIGSVAPGASSSVTLTVRVTATAACQICNIAKIQSPDQAGGASVSSNQVCVSASPASDPSTAKASGNAVGLKAYVPALSIPLINVEFSRSASSQTGVGVNADSDQLLNLDILGVLGLLSVAKANVLTTDTVSRVTQTAGARQTSVSEVAGLNVLNGLVTADLVRSVASTTARGDGSSFSAAGTTATNLRVNGSSVTNLTPGTRINLPKAAFGNNAYVAINEQTGTTSSPGTGVLSGGTYAADLTVTMVRVVVTGGTVGGLLVLGGPPLEITIAKSTAHSEHKQTTLCTSSPTKTVSGHAFIASAEVNSLLETSTVGYVEIPASGGTANKSVTASVLPTDGSVVSTNSAAANTTGTNGATSSTSSSYAQAAGVCVLKLLSNPNCAVSATLIRSQANSTATNSSRSSNATGTQFTNLNVLGIPIAGTPAPNTVIPLPLGLGFIILNEQVPDAVQTGHTGLTVRAIRIVLNLPLGPLVSGAEVIVAEAHSDATWR